MAAWAGDGEMPVVPYLLSDMAADAVAVLTPAPGVERADVVGDSLGGMIQTIAIQHPDRGPRRRRSCRRSASRRSTQSVPEVGVRVVPADGDPD
ncbi:MAG: hypothetical protein QM760_21700 [Nibricoccus sp.]